MKEQASQSTKIEEKEKLLITASVTIRDKTYSISYDLNTVACLTEKKARKCCETLVPSMTWALREEGKIINPLVFD